MCVLDLEERKRERAPEFLSNFADIVTVEGKETKLSLRIAGYPSPRVNWLFDGRDVVPSDYIDMTYDEGKEACFYLRIARPEHTGKYTCCLSNKFGTAEVTASVTVATKPVISSKFSDLEKFIGESARFACKYTGFPKPDVTWYHNKHVLTVSGPSILRLWIITTPYLFFTSNINNNRILLRFFVLDMNELILHCDTATEGCVSNDFFRHSLDDSLATYLT